MQKESPLPIAADERGYRPVFKNDRSEDHRAATLSPAVHSSAVIELKSTGVNLKKNSLSLAFLVIAPLAALAQSQPPPMNPAGLAEMKKLEFLVGNWQGSGWMQLGPGQRGNSSVTESVQSKLGGRVFVIEGLGKSRVEGSSEERVVHNAFAFLFYDQEAKRYAMRAFLANGQAVDADASYNDGVFEWGFQVPQGRIRYKIRLNEKQQWFEEGSISLDGGKSFQKFFEMTLDRIK